MLDIGCGTGWWIQHLVGAGVAPESVHGVDILEERVAAAARRVPGATVTMADARALPYDDARFSAVTLMLVLSSLEGQAAMRAAVAEASRVCRGTIVVWEPRVRTPWNPYTRLVPAPLLESALGPPRAHARITLLPPLARLLPGDRAYALFSGIKPLCTHRLAVFGPCVRPGEARVTVRQ